MTFGELTERCTPEERRELAWHLAMYRARRTLEVVIPRERGDAPMMELPPEGWKPNNAD